jgi:hypothetical protein
VSVAATARIVVALDPDAPSELALEMARYLQGSSAAELLGLFVEDSRLLAHASSALAREIVLTGRERRLERPALERQIRAQATEQRRRFEAAATHLGLRHAFHVARGEWVAELLHEAADAEALVVTLAAHAAALRGVSMKALRELAHAQLRNVLFAREGWTTGRRIVTLLTHAETRGAAVQTALRCASASRSPLTVLLGGGAEKRAAEIERLLTATAAAAHLGAPRFLPAAALTPAALYGAARDARLLVMPAPRSTSEEALIDAMLEGLRVPLLLVREEEYR